MIRERSGYEVVCDNCGRVSDTVHIGCLTNQLETDRLTGAGWLIGEQDYCPECTKELKAKPCPFCGCEEIKERSIHGGYSLMCENCMMESAEYRTRIEAYTHWNTRAVKE